MINNKVYVRHLMYRLAREDAKSAEAYMRAAMGSNGIATIAGNVQSLIMWKLAVRVDQNSHEVY